MRLRSLLYFCPRLKDRVQRSWRKELKVVLQYFGYGLSFSYSLFLVCDWNDCRLLAAAVNSFYSFWWDVTNDWGFELLKFNSPHPTPNGSARESMSPPRPLILPSLHSKSLSSPRNSVSSPSTSHTTYPPTNYQTNKTPFGLRSTLLYPLPVYPLLIFLNLLLRLTWSIKLSSHLHAHSSEGSVVIFWLEVAEVVRRWMWVFVRVEWEVVKNMQVNRRLIRVEGEYDGEEYELHSPIPDGDAFDGV